MRTKYNQSHPEYTFPSSPAPKLKNVVLKKVCNVQLKVVRVWQGKLTAVKVAGRNTTVTAVMTRITALSREVAMATWCDVAASLVPVSAMLMLFAESRCAILL